VIKADCVAYRIGGTLPGRPISILIGSALDAPLPHNGPKRLVPKPACASASLNTAEIGCGDAETLQSAASPKSSDDCALLFIHGVNGLRMQAVEDSFASSVPVLMRWQPPDGLPAYQCNRECTYDTHMALETFVRLLAKATDVQAAKTGRGATAIVSFS